ncbi:isoprenylcysteine carboxylmethyltransferase family protein [Paenibacillus sp. BSR1-1]|uniref:isoprenylcysteine carboxyl methyltransferase family protein n=1 Tax=Paenibacillus sp. BSR1-1 TaxID=3020845 RepID=UPI0025B01127|nr:isoprenylcysteine carboxylmethyltransferase family protein [Paenibacillus sp. BSR1-1]MDN3016765.1 isoprenylcysteine carboxylmethyltransferase family protein [Paenibacillus sp. BSR1-1]
MKDFLPFILFFSFIILQRIVEVLVAKNNESWMKKRGAIEFGEKHYRFMVLMHSLFFISLLLEKLLFNRGFSTVWPWVLMIFVLAQFFRIWVIASLGRFWNTKIIVLPDAPAIRKGPYRYIRHPNYFVVTIEFLVIPTLFSAYLTACLFTIFNAIMLAIRIREEENALKSITEYEGTFKDCHRFIPKFDK